MPGRAPGTGSAGRCRAAGSAARARPAAAPPRPRPRRPSGAAIRRAEGPAPELLAAAAAERGQHARGQQRGGGQLVGEGQRRAAAGRGRGRGGGRRRARPARLARRRRPMADRVPALSPLAARRWAWLAVRPWPRCCTSVRASAGVRWCPGGDRLDAGAVRVGRHAQHPAGPDQAGDGEPGAVRLEPVLVQLEDLPVAPAVAEVVLRDLPQALVVAPDGRLDHVDLLAPGPVRLLAVGAAARRRLAAARRRGRAAAQARTAARRGAAAAGGWWANAGDSAVAAVTSSSAAVTSRCTSVWVPPASGTLAGMPALRTRPGPRRSRSTPAAARPARPPPRDLEDGEDVEPVGEHRQRRHGVRDRQPEHGDQRDGHARRSARPEPRWPAARPGCHRPTGGGPGPAASRLVSVAPSALPSCGDPALGAALSGAVLGEAAENA